MYDESSELLQRFDTTLIRPRNPKEEDSVTKSKKFTAAVAASAVASAMVAPAAFAGTTFSDIDGSYAKDAILKLADAGIITGTGAGAFNPAGNIERQDFAIILAKSLKLDTTTAPAAATFSDVPKDHYAFAAVEAAVKAGLIKGTGNGQFGEGANLSREDLAALFGRALNFVAGKDVIAGKASKLTFSDAANIADYAKDAVGAAFELGYISGDNGKFDPQGTATREQLASMTTRFLDAAEKVKTPAAGSATVSATAANTVTVKFNGAVDTTKAVFAVKKGATTVSVDAATWNDAKTEATLKKSSGNFTEGDYTVSVTGVTTEAITGTVKFEAQKVAKVEILGDAAIRDKADKTKATVSFKVSDQYGTDITKTSNISTNNITASAGVTVTAIDRSKATITLNYGAAGIGFDSANAPTKFVLAVVDPGTGTTASKTLDIAASAKISKFEFGELTLPTNSSNVYVAKDEAGYVEFTAVDQYGNNVTDATLLGASLTIISSDKTKVDYSFKKINDKTVIVVDSSKALAADAGTYTLTVVNPDNGAAVTKTIKVEKQSAPATIAFGELSNEVVADGDDVFMDITVTDQFGNTMKADDYANLNVANDLKLTATGPLAGDGAIDLVWDKNSKNYGKLKLHATGKGKATMITTLTSTNNTFTVDVKDARVLTEVNGVTGTQYLTQGASADLGFKFLDQYGQQFDEVLDTANMTYSITLEKVSGDDNAVTVTAPAGAADESDLNQITVKGTDGKTGTYKVTVQLLDGADATKILSESTATVTTIKNNVAGLTYSIKAIPTLDGQNASTFDATSIYARTVKVLAKDANGNNVAINPADVVSVTSSNNKVADVAKNVAGTWKVFGKDITANNNVDDKKATISVTLNTLDGIKTVTSEVTVSTAKAVAQDLMIVDSAMAPGSVQDSIDYATSIPQDKYYYTTYSQTDLEDGVSFYALAKDQYGVISNVDLSTATIVTNSTNKVAADAFSFVAGALTLDPAKINNGVLLTSGTQLVATVLFEGKSKQITITIK